MTVAWISFKTNSIKLVHCFFSHLITPTRALLACRFAPNTRLRKGFHVSGSSSMEITFHSWRCRHSLLLFNPFPTPSIHTCLFLCRGWSAVAYPRSLWAKGGGRQSITDPHIDSHTHTYTLIPGGNLETPINLIVGGSQSTQREPRRASTEHPHRKAPPKIRPGNLLALRQQCQPPSSSVWQLLLSWCLISYFQLSFFCLLLLCKLLWGCVSSTLLIIFINFQSGFIIFAASLLFALWSTLA